MNTKYIKANIKYLASIQKEYPKKDIIQYQISFLHSCLEFHYSNGVNKTQLGRVTNGSDSWLIEESTNSEIQKFVRSTKNKAFDNELEWIKFTSSPYRRGVNIDMISVDSQALLDMISKTKTTAKVVINFLSNDVTIAKMTTVDNKVKYQLVALDVVVTVGVIKYNEMIHIATHSYTYIISEVNGNRIINGYDADGLAFEYTIDSKTMVKYINNSKQQIANDDIQHVDEIDSIGSSNENDEAVEELGIREGSAWSYLNNKSKG